MKTLSWKNALSGYLARFLRSASGSIIVPFAVASPVLLAASGLAIDYATHSMKVAELQSAADASALGAAKELALAGSSDAAIKSVAASYVAMELSGRGSTVTSTADINRGAGTLRVALEELWTPTFAHFLNADITPIRVDATASLVGGTNICVLALDGSATNAIHLDKNAKLQANGCGVYSNSTHAQGIRLDMDSSMHASSICSTGGYKSKTTAVSPTPTTDCPAVPDPLIDRTAPGIGSCDETNLTLAGGSHTLSPGTYCGGLKIKGTASVTFTPGTYIIKDGKFVVSDNAKIIGEHVGFYLLGNATIINFTDQASVTLTGAMEGDMAGLLFFEDRSAPINRKHHIQSTNVDVLTGTIYLPRGQLLVDPNTAVAEDSAYTAIIANRLELTEGPELVLNSDYGATDVPVPAGIQSTAQVVLSE
jgi:Flp pilus assembly protein TadG